MFDKNWDYLSSNNEYKSISDELLRIRGIKDPDSFLIPDFNNLHDPFLMNDMHKAVSRIRKALEKNQTICIYGDYDADGLTSAAILVRYLRSLEANVEYYIPDRFDDGYGLNIDSLGLIADKGTKLVITTDCGINSVKEVEFLNKKDVDIIITDHHMLIGELPKAYAVICCTRADNIYPYENLSGAGVAFKLASALNMSLSINEIDKNLILLAALGTVADIVPLDGENRIIVRRGMELIKEGINCGVDALLENAATGRKNISSYTIGFILGPRINAAGRMGKADSALELLLTDDFNKSRELAEILSKLNSRRKKEQNDIYNNVLDDLRKNPEILEFPVIVAAGENYNKGVIGIVASKISEIFKKPCILLCISGESAEGSGRSKGELSLIDALKYCSGVLESFGGHRNAAGLSLDTSNIVNFKKMLAEYAMKEGYPGSDGNKMIIDLCISPGNLNITEVQKIADFEPYGIGNSKPVFAMEEVTLEDYRIIGSDRKHLSLRFGKDNKYYKAVCFNSSQYEPLLNLKGIYNIAFTAEINEFRGNRNIQLMIIDIEFPDYDEYILDLLIVRLLVHMVKYEKGRRIHNNLSDLSAKFYEIGMPGAAKRILGRGNDFFINREKIGEVYNEVSKIEPGGAFNINNGLGGLMPDEICFAIEIMIELGILKVYREGMYTYRVFDKPDMTKKKLEKSLIYNTFRKLEGRNG